MTFDEWFDKHYPNHAQPDNDDPLLRKAKRMMWDEIAAAMDNDKIHVLAAIDEALGLPADGCNSTLRTLRTIAEIQRLRQSPPAQTIYPYYGWVCPRCGRGNAPTTQTCSCVPAPPLVWTC